MRYLSVEKVSDRGRLTDFIQTTEQWSHSRQTKEMSPAEEGKGFNRKTKQNSRTTEIFALTV